MMPQVVVSVIIITWNNAAHLIRCLNALKNETYKNFEVIIVDNGSNDSSIEGTEQGDLSVKMEQLDRNKGFTVPTISVPASPRDAGWIS